MATNLISIEQACMILGVSRRTIYNWLATGKLQCVRTAGGRVRILEESMTKPDTKWSEQA